MVSGYAENADRRNCSEGDIRQAWSDDVKETHRSGEFDDTPPVLFLKPFLFARFGSK